MPDFEGDIMGVACSARHAVAAVRESEPAAGDGLHQAHPAQQIGLGGGHLHVAGWFLQLGQGIFGGAYA